MRMIRSTVRVNWDSDPSMTLRLLELIDSKDKYRQAFFPKSITRVNGVYIIHAEACIEFFAEDDWINDAKERGLVVKNPNWRRGEEGLHSKWKRVEEKWTSTIANPLTSRVSLLTKRFKNHKYEEDFGMDPQWSDWDDISIKEEREEFKEHHPYYFLLRKLVNPSRGPSTVLPRPPPSSSSGRPSLRRRRSSTSSASSCSSSRSKARSSSSSPAPVREKRRRRIESSVVEDDVDAWQSSALEEKKEKEDRIKRTPGTARDLVADSSRRAQGMLAQDVTETESDSESSSDESMDSDGMSSTELESSDNMTTRAVHQPAWNEETQRAQSIMPLSVSERARVAPPSRSTISVIRGVRVGGGGVFTGPGRTVDDAIEIDDASSPVEVDVKDESDDEEVNPDVEQQAASREPLQIQVAHNPLDEIEDTPYAGTDDCVLDWNILRGMPTLKLIQMIVNGDIKKKYPLSTGWAQPAVEQKAAARSEVFLETLTRLHTDCPLQIKSAQKYQLLVDADYLSKGFRKGVVRLATALGYEMDLLSSPRIRYIRLYANRQQNNGGKAWDTYQFLQATWDSAMSCISTSINQLIRRVAQTNEAKRSNIQICTQKDELHTHRQEFRKGRGGRSILKPCEDNHNSQKGLSTQCRVHVTMDAIRGGREFPAIPVKGAAQCMSPARTVKYINEYLDRVRQE